MKATAETKFSEKFKTRLADAPSVEEVKRITNSHREMVMAKIQDAMKWAYDNSTFKTQNYNYGKN